MVQERILIVDGCVAFSKRVQTRLQAMGYLVSRAFSAKQAMKILEAQWVDLLILNMDIKGPVDGGAFFRTLKKKKEFCDIPIVIQANKALASKTFTRAGAPTFFVKPDNIDFFLHEVKDILTTKVLVLSTDETIQEGVARALAAYDCQVVILDTVNQFYEFIASYRYRFVVMQDKLRTSKADRMIAIVRGSKKNTDVPVVVFTTDKKKTLNDKQLREMHIRKVNSLQWGECLFFDNGYSKTQFSKIAKQFLG